ncbi:MAG: sulfatase-like hydrolase/transferase, partial [Cyclobacteriaceae bacterium]|nr:sulfatase-like hydrolase/transferase [Cyclobacteriaceae bacterium]
MKVFIPTVIILFTVMTIFASNSEKQKPNIVLLMADDMGYECIGANGSTAHDTPFLDKLGEKGIKFNYAISQPLCTPSRV